MEQDFVSALAEFEARQDARFAQIDRRFAQIDGLEGRFDRLELDVIALKRVG